MCHRCIPLIFFVFCFFQVYTPNPLRKQRNNKNIMPSKSSSAKTKDIQDTEREPTSAETQAMDDGYIHREEQTVGGDSQGGGLGVDQYDESGDDDPAPADVLKSKSKSQSKSTSKANKKADNGDNGDNGDKMIDEDGATEDDEPRHGRGGEDEDEDEGSGSSKEKHKKGKSGSSSSSSKKKTASARVKHGAGFNQSAVAKRHRNNKAVTTERALLGISHNACQRGTHRAGVYRMSGEVPDEARKKVKTVLEAVLKDAIAVVEYCKRNTITGNDVQFAIANQKNRTATPRIYS